MVGFWRSLLSWLADGHPLSVFSHLCSLGVCPWRDKESKLSAVCSYKGVNPTLVISSKPNHLPKTSPPNTITSEVKISAYELEVSTHIQSMVILMSPLTGTSPRKFRVISQIQPTWYLTLSRSKNEFPNLPCKICSSQFLPHLSPVCSHPATCSC